jgi:hypothetical protein
VSDADTLKALQALEVEAHDRIVALVDDLVAKARGIAGHEGPGASFALGGLRTAFAVSEVKHKSHPPRVLTFNDVAPYVGKHEHLSLRLPPHLEGNSCEGEPE